MARFKLLDHSCPVNFHSKSIWLTWRIGLLGGSPRSNTIKSHFSNKLSCNKRNICCILLDNLDWNFINAKLLDLTFNSWQWLAIAWPSRFLITLNYLDISIYGSQPDFNTDHQVWSSAINTANETRFFNNVECQEKPNLTGCKSNTDSNEGYTIIAVGKQWATVSSPRRS